MCKLIELSFENVLFLCEYLTNVFIFYYFVIISLLEYHVLKQDGCSIEY